MERKNVLNNNNKLDLPTKNATFVVYETHGDQSRI
jgi:hypothetical protein